MVCGCETLSLSVCVCSCVCVSACVCFCLCGCERHHAPCGKFKLSTCRSQIDTIAPLGLNLYIFASLLVFSKDHASVLQMRIQHILFDGILSNLQLDHLHLHSLLIIKVQPAALNYSPAIATWCILQIPPFTRNI